MTMRQYYKSCAPAHEIEDMIAEDTADWGAKMLGISVEEYRDNTSKSYSRLLVLLRGMWADAMLLEDETH